ENLFAYTDYTISVQAVCSETDSSDWSPTVAFRTECEALTTFPWTEDFESVTTPALPICWSYINNNEDGDYWKTFTSYGVNSSKAAGIYTDINNGNNDDYLVLPQFTLTGNQRLIYSVRAYSTGEPNDYRVVLSTTGSDPTDFTNVLMPLTQVDYTTMTEIDPIDLSAYSGDVYIAIHIPAGGLDGWYIYFDNFIVEDIPTCLKPTDVDTNLVMPTYAEIGWTANSGETSWLVKVNGVDTLVTDNPATLLNLTANTDYTVQVQAICSETDSSQWSNPISFYTGFCIPAPTSIDGDGITNVTFGQTQIVNNNTHPTAAPYYGDYTAQVGDGQQGTPVTVNITYATGQTYGTPIWVNWNNDCEFTDDELVYWGTSTDVEPTTLTASFTIPLGTPLGNYSMRIGGSDYQFDNADNLDPCLSTSWTIYEDYTLQVVEAPACLPVVDVEINNITAHEAEVSWTEQGSAVNWIILLNDSSIVVTENPYLLENISADTYYTVSVQAICSETDTSALSIPTSFTTFCEIITVTDNTPFEEGFENDFGCWSQVYDVATQDWIITNSTTQIQPYEGSSFAAFGAESFGGEATKLISPLLDITGVTNPYVKFAHTQPAWDSDQNQLVVYYRASQTDPWTELVSYTNNITAWTLDSVQLPNASATYQVAFKGVDFYGYEVSLDAVFVGNIIIPEPACETPTNVTVVPDSNSAVVSWTATDETSWNIEYGPAGFTQGAGTMINDVTTNPYTITNLTPETPYDVYVQAICSEDSITDWSAVQSFTTTTVGIAEYEGLNVSLYPNPANSEINVQLSASLHNGQIAIYDVYGKLLKQVAVEGNLTTINIQNMASGVYFVRILDGNNILQTMKVVKK
ncbi:MAG: choice-of-anchor J domain-containing protein, partial [Bacteroidales bacterium]|nr:choice-of-anchor J domain-containing protein [Bacteroidales bacterium]